MSGFAYEMAIAFAGMLADSAAKNVVSVPCGVEPLRFGIVVHRDAQRHAVPPSVAGSAVAGVTVHDHLNAWRGGYVQHDAVNVLDLGTIWVRAGGVCTPGKAVKYADDGTVSDGAARALPNAVFVGGDQTIPGGFDEPAVRLAQIRLGYPLAT